MADRVPKLTPREAAALAEPGASVYVAGCCGEPAAVLDAVALDPDLWRSVVVSGVFIPGVNRRDYSALGKATIVRTIFASEGLRAGSAAGQVEMLPLHYSDFWRALSRPGAVDVAYFQVPPPRRDGTVGFGTSADFTPAVADSGATLVGIVNPNMPDVPDGPRLPTERFSGMVEDDTPLIEYDPGPMDEAIGRVAAHIATVVRDGDTIQLGLGKLQRAVLRALGSRRNLALHGGMISPPVLDAANGGVLSRGITTGVALGGRAFLREAGRRSDIRFRPVGYTHAADVLSAIPNFVSINSVIEVDLSGQANAETLGGRQISGQGGMVDFVRGARSSRGGRAILALPATARDQSVSRIVAALGPRTPVSVARADVDIVVTEFGIAELRDAGLRTRAERLIAIAAPKFRDQLADEFGLAARSAAECGG